MIDLAFSIALFPTAFATEGAAFGTAKNLTWREFAPLIQRRRQGPKDGVSFVPAKFRPEPDGTVRRIKENLLARTAIALDVESDKGTGELPPPISAAAARVAAQGWRGVIYSSHSHTPERPRYRVVLPLSAEINADLPAPEVIAEILGLQGVVDRGKVGAASLFYFPSCAPGQEDAHETSFIEGDAVDAAWITDRAGGVLAAREAERERERQAALEAAARRREERIRQGLDPDASVIEQIRQRLDLEGELVAHGYRPAGRGRFLFPGSESGVAGVYVLCGSDGVDRVYSHHAADPLAAGNLPSWCRAKALDAVDVAVILGHGGDLKAGLRTLATRFGIETRPLVTRAEPPPPCGEDDYGDTTTRPPPAEEAAPIEPNTELADALSVISWAALDIPPEKRLLGDLITSSSRMFLVGSTGLGKTLLCYAMVGGMAAHGEFLQWKGDRPSKWLIIDGEMPSALVKARAADMIRRAGGHTLPPHNAMIYSRDRADEFSRLFPSLGQMAPLNTEAGHQFVMDLIAAVGGIDGIAFDNVMSLAPGDQKDEEIWAGCIPLVDQISRAGIAQIWCDHTGHNTGRQYGSNTKSWRFDAVGIMTPLGETEQPTDHVAFKLSFDSPGKARRRTPDNWQDFEPRIIRLVDDEWSSEPVKAVKAAEPEARLNDKTALMLMEIRAALTGQGRYQEIEKGGDAVLSVGRQIVRERLIKGGWFPESMLSDAFTLTRPAYTTETNELRKLKRKGFIDFNREFVWRN